jgi:hypothetical protein
MNEREALTDEQIVALNAGERFFSESPSKYPEAGHGTQYHCGLPGLLKFARAVAALSQPSPAVPNSEMWRHKKSGGIYAWVMTVVREDDQKVLVVYRGVNDGVRWARPAAEFYDGRFERIDADDQPTEPAQPVAATWKVYQIKQALGKSIWMDASWAEFQECMTEKRVLHAKLAQPATQAGAGEQRFADAFQKAGLTEAQMHRVWYHFQQAASTTEQPGDAERYNWLRTEIEAGRLTIAKPGAWHLEPWSGDDPDGRIDAARAAHGKGGA